MFKKVLVNIIDVALFILVISMFVLIQSWVILIFIIPIMWLVLEHYLIARQCYLDSEK